jgi:hypothetical protein
LALEFFALLRREIGFQENLAWIALLRDGEHRRGEEKYGGETSGPASHYTTPQRHTQPSGERFPVHRR